MRTRPNSFSKRGVITSSSLYASAAGIKMLEKEGNMFDAPLATSAVLTVTQNNLCGLGGDMFALLRSGGGDVININGSGRAFSSASIEFFKARTTLSSYGLPKNIATAALFLASDDSDYMNGQVLTVDGGRTDNLTHSI